MQINFEHLDEEEKSEQEFNFEDIFQINDHLIFLLDFSATHFKNKSVEESNLDIFLECYSNVLKKKIISSNNNKVGLVLYNCHPSNNPLGFPRISVLKELGPI